MARTNEEKLRKCPVCRTPVAETELGLRDYNSWLSDSLPAKVGASDLDCVIEQSRTGRVLILEFKPAGAWLPTGQKILLKRFVKAGMDVWVVWEKPAGPVSLTQYDTYEVGIMDASGNVIIKGKLDKPGLKEAVQKWWESGFDD